MQIPKSNVDGIVFPGLASGRTASMTALQLQLEQTQWLPEEELLQYQLRQLERLLDHAFRTSPYYNQKLRKLDLRRARRLTPELWWTLPVLSRAELQSAGSALNSQRVPASHGKVCSTSSSGSVGRPITVNKTMLCQFLFGACTNRDHLWHQRNFEKTVAVIRHTSNEAAARPPGAKSRNWGDLTHLLYPTGPSVVLHSKTDIDVQAQWLKDLKPTYFLSYPSLIQELARYFIAEKLDLPSLHHVTTFGEALGGETRELCREAWDRDIVDMYSSQETGYLALQCPKHEHYHVQSENALVEVLKDDGAPCRPGEFGRVVVTVLHNFATPLIRYEIGDYAEVGEPCDCGRGLPVLKQVLGRTRNMLVLPDGKVRRPSVGIRNFEKIAPVRQAQLIQHDIETVEANLVTDDPLSPDQEQRLAKMIQDEMGHPFEIKLTYLDEIPRGPTGKYEDFVSRVTR